MTTLPTRVIRLEMNYESNSAQKRCLAEDGIGHKWTRFIQIELPAAHRQQMRDQYNR